MRAEDWRSSEAATRSPRATPAAIALSPSAGSFLRLEAERNADEKGGRQLEIRNRNFSRRGKRNSNSHSFSPTASTRNAVVNAGGSRVESVLGSNHRSRPNSLRFDPNRIRRSPSDSANSHEETLARGDSNSERRNSSEFPHSASRLDVLSSVLPNSDSLCASAPIRIKRFGALLTPQSASQARTNSSSERPLTASSNLADRRRTQDERRSGLKLHRLCDFVPGSSPPPVSASASGPAHTLSYRRIKSPDVDTRISIRSDSLCARFTPASSSPHSRPRTPSPRTLSLARTRQRQRKMPPSSRVDEGCSPSSSIDATSTKLSATIVYSNDSSNETFPGPKSCIRHPSRSFPRIHSALRLPTQLRALSCPSSPLSLFPTSTNPSNHPISDSSTLNHSPSSSQIIFRAVWRRSIGG